MANSDFPEAQAQLGQLCGIGVAPFPIPAYRTGRMPAAEGHEIVRVIDPLRPKGLAASRRTLPLPKSGGHHCLQISNAAVYPLFTAPSMVAGSPVWVQSPARKRPRTGVTAGGLKLAASALGENVANRSLITRE